MYSYIQGAEAEITLNFTRSLIVNETAIHSHRDKQNMQDSYLNGIFAA